MESPDRSNHFFKRPPKKPFPSGPFLGSIFPLTPNVAIISIQFSLQKVSPIWGLQHLIWKFRLLFYKFVPINFLDAKNGPKRNQTRFFVFLHLHRKVIIIVVFFFYLKVVPLGPSSCGWIQIRFFLTLWCLEQKRGAPKETDPFSAFLCNVRYSLAKTNNFLTPLRKDSLESVLAR